MSTSVKKEIGILIIVVIKAKDLSDPSLFGKSSPFCKLYLSNSTKVATTPNKRGGQHPVWDEEFRLTVYTVDDAIPRLGIKIYSDEDEREMIGEAELEIDTEGWVDYQFDEWVPLHLASKPRGELFLEMTFYPLHHVKASPERNLVRHPTRLVSETRPALPAIPSTFDNLDHLRPHLHQNGLPYHLTAPIPPMIHAHSADATPYHSHSQHLERPLYDDRRHSSAHESSHGPLPFPGERQEYQSQEYQSQEYIPQHHQYRPPSESYPRLSFPLPPTPPPPPPLHFARPVSPYATSSTPPSLPSSPPPLPPFPPHLPQAARPSLSLNSTPPPIPPLPPRIPISIGRPTSPIVTSSKASTSTLAPPPRRTQPSLSTASDSTASSLSSSPPPLISKIHLGQAALLARIKQEKNDEKMAAELAKELAETDLSEERAKGKLDEEYARQIQDQASKLDEKRRREEEADERIAREMARD